MDKEGPVPERSSFSFNERAWEAWDPWSGSSVSEPAALPPLRPPLDLTFQVLQLLSRTEGNVDLRDLWLVLAVGNLRFMYCIWNIVTERGWLV